MLRLHLASLPRSGRSASAVAPLPQSPAEKWFQSLPAPPELGSIASTGDRVPRNRSRASLASSGGSSFSVALEPTPLTPLAAGTGSSCKYAAPAECCASRSSQGPGSRFPSGLEHRGARTAVAMERGAGGRTSSALFAGFRALGLFSTDIAHVVRFSALKRRFYVTTCVGKSFHTYDVSDVFLRPLPGNHPPPSRAPALCGGSPALVPLSSRTEPGLPFLPVSSLTPVGAISPPLQIHVLLNLALAVRLRRPRTQSR